MEPLAPDRFRAVREHVRAGRLRQGWTQEQLAVEAEVPDDYVRNLESRTRCVRVPGDARSPESWAQFRAVCLALGEQPEAVLKSKGVM